MVWFSVVLCGSEAMAYCRTITLFPAYIMQLGICYLILIPGAVIRKYKIRFKSG